MDIFSVLTMIGGLALFLYGMNAMGDGLSKLSGGKLEQILEKLTSNRLMAVLLGAGVTAIIQSSSATTVMVVGFVNSGIMKLQQAVGIIMGANIGTTMTSWLLSLIEVDGASFVMKMLKPTSFSPILAAIGIIMIMTAKDNTKKNDIGNILVGFAILMTGMDTMSGAVKPLANNEEFTSILTMFSNPILGMIAGAILTAVIQSSSASVGILQALCATGAVGFSSAIPIIMGQNIGTCITALMSSFGASKNAKRASMMHLYFNLIGTLVFMAVFYAINAIAPFEFLNGPADATGIAMVHTVFNVSCAVCWFPFANFLVKLAMVTIPDKADEVEETKEFAVLDERFLEQPAFAMQLCRNTAIKMAETARDAFFLALDNLTEFSEEKVEKILEMESIVDRYEDALGSYLVKLNNKVLTQEDNHTLSVLLHCINDYERISDHATNLADCAKSMNKKQLQFSPNALKELEVFTAAVHEIVETSVDVFKKNDIENAKMVEPLEQVINGLNAEIKKRHIKRLRKGKCTIEMGIILQDVLTNLERIADHCSNIAVCIIEVKEDTLGAHGYLIGLRENNAKWFTNAVYVLKDKYKLPEVTIDEEESYVVNINTNKGISEKTESEKKEKSKGKSKDKDKKKK
ncbi:MAG: Na/Pi cotransporter family protein [Lachnospiraceae bacterium]|nr:Na/Pi cotransporter family protein [Lachnospiraceae bacterium]